MILFGGLLLVAGVVLAVVGGGDIAGGWLLPGGLIAGGLGVLVAGVVARVRRRIAPVRAVARAHRTATGPEANPLRRARAVPGMLGATWRGRNPALPRYQLLLWGLALVYLVSPVDVLPEFLPLLGITDDIGVGAWLLTSVYAESGNYLAQRADHPDES
ncbi:YkvA family protein [Saccharopolyspora sp. CA-218241]|uniref:YkvA family protein n=1 Tax=Saccharopolyspora sp. CA-218241 TaxID=3240027 RepID=UPI003D992D84